MLVTALGHAGLAIRDGAALVLVDPWFAPSGAFDASWFVFPDNLHVVDDLEVPDAVVVTHEHFDHLDPWYLARLPDEVPVVIPDFPGPVLRRKVEASGHTNIIEVPDRERLEVAPGIGVRFVREESPMNHDGAVVIDTPTGNVVDLNDARLFPVQLREVRAELGGSIDVLALQGSGASWYPLVYDYPPERIEALCADKRAAKLSYVARAVEVAEPAFVLPFAGPPCFLDPELAWVNAQMDGGIFPDQRQVAASLEARGVTGVEVLLPGESLSVPDGAVEHDERWAGFWELDRAAYLADYAARRLPEIEAVLAAHPEPTGAEADGLAEAFAAHGRHLLSLSDYWNGRIGMRVGFDVTGPGGGAWHIDFRPGREGVGVGLDECGYVHRFASRWLPPILRGAITWEDFFLSLRFGAHRDPDLYNDHLLGLLKFADAGIEALDLVEAYERSIDRSARVTVAAPDGRRWSVSRWCTHAGSDLRETGEVLEGDVLQCLAHHYRFDLTTGACANGRCEPLDVAPVDPDVDRADAVDRSD